jgi:hypothetical protein
MPNLPVSIDSTARRMGAVIASFGPRSRESALDAPRAPTSTRPRRVAAFIGATQSAGRAGRIQEPPRGPSTAEAFPAWGHLAPANSDHPLVRSPTSNQEEP